MKNAKALFFAALMSATGIALGDGCSTCSTCPKSKPATTICNESGCTVTPAGSAAPIKSEAVTEEVDVDGDDGVEVVEVDTNAEGDVDDIADDVE